MLKTGLRGLSSAFCLFSFVLFGCNGEGRNDGPPAPAPAAEPVLESSSTDYDFGDVTLSNSPAEKIITITNTGTDPVVISSIELTGDGHALDLDTGENPCGSTLPTIVAGGSCDVGIDFTPTDSGSSNGSLTVNPDDSDIPELVIPVTGTGVVVTEPIVHINQVVPDSCPSSALTVYVSVTDQVGYPISDLTMSNFNFTESFNGSSAPVPIQSLETVDTVIDPIPISVTLVMDYSSSVTDDPVDVQAMEDSAISFINQLGTNDEAEIIKFDSVVEVVQPFTLGDSAGKAILIATIEEPWDKGDHSLIYAAINKAVADTAVRQTERRAVIALSDFFDNPETGNSDTTLSELLANAAASNVPIFTVGLGSNLNIDVLDSLASETGGQSFEASTADNLRTIYQQQAQILFVDQYVLPYVSIFEAGDSAELEVGVRLDEQSDYVYDSRTIAPCPSPL
jgi:VWFA-related protein